MRNLATKLEALEGARSSLGPKGFANLKRDFLAAEKWEDEELEKFAKDVAQRWIDHVKLAQSMPSPSFWNALHMLLHATLRSEDFEEFVIKVKAGSHK